MAIRHDLNGHRVKHPSAPQVYLIDSGRRRWIPNPATYNNLFRDWDGIIVDANLVNSVDAWDDIADGALLARAEGTGEVFFIDNRVKRRIISPAAMDRYYFNWGAIRQVPQIVLDAVPGPIFPDISAW
jgi:molybdate-binding protein